MRLGLFLAAAVALFAVAHVAHAGDGLSRGSIRVSDAGTTNNQETGYLDGLATANDRPFALGNNTPYDVQCESPGAYVSTDTRGTDAGRGVKLSTDQLYSVTTAAGGTNIPLIVDGGSYNGGVIAIAPLVGQCCALCRILPRTGQE